MRRANEFSTARIVIDRHPYVGTGPFTGHKITIAKVDQETALTIGWIGEADRAILWHIGVPDHRTSM
jgi:hypothetical protein